MRVLLIDADTNGRRKTFPNLALMKLSAWHKAQGASVALAPAVWFPDQVYISSVFSWNRAEVEAARRLYPHAEVGGTGIDLLTALPAEVEAMRPDYDLYGVTFGVGFLQRGCTRTCPFCVVPRKEGKPRIVAALSDLINSRSKFVVLLDNNFLSLGEWSMETLREIADRRLAVNFSQGIDIRLVTPENAHLLAAVDFRNTRGTRRRLTFAFDHVGMERAVRQGVATLAEAGIAPTYLQAFLLAGFDSSFEEDMHRVQALRALGVDPFVMVYRDPLTGEKNPDPRLRHFARWANAHQFRGVPWAEYKPALKGEPL